MSDVESKPRSARVAGRTKAQSIRDSMLRKLVDPSSFRTPVVIDDRVRELRAGELNELVKGLSVRIRSASRGVEIHRHKGPGPGEYQVASIRSGIGPRWSSDIASFSDEDRAAKVFPGPTAYVPKIPSTARTPRVSSRLPEVNAKTSCRFPGPGSYNPHEPPSTKRFEISPESRAIGDEILVIRPGPCQYNTPSIFDPRPGNASQHTARWSKLVDPTPGPGQYEVPSIAPVQMAYSARRKQYH